MILDVPLLPPLGPLKNCATNPFYLIQRGMKIYFIDFWGVCPPHPGDDRDHFEADEGGGMVDQRIDIRQCPRPPVHQGSVVWNLRDLGRRQASGGGLVEKLEIRTLTTPCNAQIAIEDLQGR